MEDVSYNICVYECYSWRTKTKHTAKNEDDGGRHYPFGYDVTIIINFQITSSMNVLPFNNIFLTQSYTTTTLNRGFPKFSSIRQACVLFVILFLVVDSYASFFFIIIALIFSIINYISTKNNHINSHKQVGMY